MGSTERKLNRAVLSPEAYFDKVLSLCTRTSSHHTDHLSLAGRTVALKTPSQTLRRYFLPALEHLVDPGISGPAGLTIWYVTDRHLAEKVPAPPWQGFNAQGFNAALPQEEVQLFFQPWQTQFFLYSRKLRTGIYWVRSAAEVPWWECTFSFRAIFHFWSRDLPAQLVHAGAMAGDGSAVLITGPSGSGKSTSCLNLLKQGYQYLGDDYVWTESGMVHSLYQTAKVEPDNLHKRFPGWVPQVSNRNTYLQQKAVFHIRDLYPGALIASAPVRAVLLPRVAGQRDTQLRRAAPSGALFAMAPTTLHHLPHHRAVSYRKLMELSGSVPGYHWLLGYDTGHFNRSFSDFLHDELPGSKHYHTHL